MDKNKIIMIVAGVAVVVLIVVGIIFFSTGGFSTYLG